MPVNEIYRTPGVLFTVEVILFEPGSTSRALNKTLVAGDVKISIDGGGLTNLTNVPVENPAGSGAYLFSFTEEEADFAEQILVVTTDQDAVAEVDPDQFVIKPWGAILPDADDVRAGIEYGVDGSSVGTLRVTRPTHRVLRRR